MRGPTGSRISSQHLRLARDGAVNYGGQVFGAILAIVVIPVLVDRLGVRDYGVLVLATSVATVLSVLDVGLGSVLTHEVAAPPKPDTDRFLRSAAGLLVLLGAFGGVVIAAAGLVGHALRIGAVGWQNALVFTFVGVGFCADQVTLYHTAVLGGRRRFDVLNGLLVCASAVRAAGVILLLRSGADVATVAAWYAAVAWALAAGNWLVVARLAPHHRLRPARPRLGDLRSRLSMGMGSLAITASTVSLWNAGPILVATINGTAAGAMYQLSQRFPMGILAFPERFSVPLFPAASEVRNEGAEPLKELIQTGTRLITLVLLPIAIVFLAGADILLDAWLRDVPQHGALILRLTAIAVFGYGLGSSALSALWGRGDVRPLSVRLGAVTCIGLLGTALLAHTSGGVGTAIALLVTALAGSVAVLSLAARVVDESIVTLVAPAISEVVLPGALAAAAALGVLWLGVTGWPGVVLLGAGAGGAYVIGFLGILGVRSRLVRARVL